ncbi:dTDP-4-dehydrorhamnose reductase [Pseudoxanthomonas indica]|uniref:dTDP-4-dehydrorhamnose reductase n=1 Tax=Pseudoxanthomonas indica TaxID=428993 RepID=A0A1T5JJQ0_9GAMM|nr:dTDP-4-dehydrorhamnose reductase [Pseudoxanthomonas indica]GGD59029.1 NAD(P)-dependent oxidoreductase [Pseudoxanthomonas indica]SKC51458.1 dTDP-4-dehydrorhamnose reductase [Pseudoxanthomonas indica]
MKILLLGANGQVGHELRRSLATRAHVVAATRDGRLDDGGECEVADFDAPDQLPRLVSRIAPDVVVNAAAYTAVDRAEEDPDAAFRTNAHAPAALARACLEAGITLVHYSTDYVFDGQAAHPYDENHATAPLSVYGASKLAGEQAIRDSGARHLIFRTAWVYGTRGRNFLLAMLQRARQGEALRVVADQYGTPTPAWLIADVTARVLAEHPHAEGTYHLTANGGTHWQGFAQTLLNEAAVLGLLAQAPSVTPIRSVDYPTRVTRPSYSRLDNSKLQNLLGEELPEWTTALDRVLESLRR